MLPQETIDRIWNDAEKAAAKRHLPESHFRIGFKEGYSCGARTELEKAQEREKVLVDALEKCIQFKNGQYEGKYLNRLWEECESALTNYGKEVDNG